ncbi:MAG: molybdate ABC transporter substrate-binding protein [Planctomyces sp.]|nr:molybdate ABC transporter substrate-binding protein [Planctomyces sp.]
MSRRLPFVLHIAAAALVCGLAACTRGPVEPADTPPAGRTSATRNVAIAAASDLRYALDEFLVGFRTRYPDVDVTATYGSSGNFFAQLSNRAPFDVFLSADSAYPEQLVAEGLGETESIFPYARGHIALWVRNDSPLDLDALGPQALVQESVRKVAIANPRHAPYGRAAEAAIQSLGLESLLESRLVLGDTVIQAAQFVESGAADIGIIGLSLTRAPALRDQGRALPLDESLHPPIEQAGLILPWAADREAAETLRKELLGRHGREILSKHGLTPPGD